MPMPMILFTISALIAFGLDRLSEVVIINLLNLASVHAISVWPPYFQLIVARNKGIDFGLLSDDFGRWALVAFATTISLGMAIWVRNKRGWILPLAIGAVVGGALGNAFDRVFYGAVVDYLNISCCGIKNPYSFNVADIFITCGTVLAAVAYKHQGKYGLPDPG